MISMGRRLGQRPRLVAVAVAVAITACVLAVQGGAQASVQEGSAAPSSSLVAKGRQLYLPGCSGCHGVNGQGLRAPNGSLRGPSLKHSGEASAYYYLHTGRMPLGNSEDEPKRHKPVYSEANMQALVAYVGSLGDGPKIPDVKVLDGDLGVGGELFRANCAACHSASGAGGALSYGRAAPSLASAKPLEIGSAVRSGPGQMPRFDRKTFDAEELNSIARYVEYLRKPKDPGGLSLGRIGPIPEGFLIWVFGIGLLLVTVSWIGKRNRPTLAGEPLGEDEA